MIKLIGAGAIIICTVGMGLHLTKKNKSSLLFIKEILEFMKYTKEKIEYFNAPIDDITENYTTQNIQSEIMIRSIKTDEWTKSLDEQKEMTLPQEASNIIKEFGKKLGKSNKQDQVAMCNYCIDRLENLYQEMQSDIPQKNKITFALCIYGGLMIIILFI